MHEPTSPGRFQPTFEDMQKLIAAAREDPLGTEFLLEGDLCAVAITFGAHVFTVEAVRENWSEMRVSKERGEQDGI
jgi:hypothetical protein